MIRYGLGRKRILDTFIAATYVTADITRIVTSNARDYPLLEGITPVVP